MRRFLMLGAFAAALACVLPAASDGGRDDAEPTAYKPGRGPFEVVQVDEQVLLDKAGNKRLAVRIRAPRSGGEERSGSRPLVIFSHGAGGSSDAFPALCAHWASHGYVVVNPTHGDSVQLRRRRGEGFDPRSKDLAQQVVGGVDLRARCADVRLILDSLDEIEAALRRAGEPGSSDAERESRPRLRIDRDRIALAGHSAGALTTQTLAGVKFYARGGRRGLSMGEPRIKAFIVISGQGLSRPAFREDSWKGIASPMLVIAGSADRSAVNDETPEGRRHPFEHAPPGDKYLLYIDGATHGSYAGKSVVRILGEKPPGNLDYITGVTAFATLAFLDAYVGSDSAGRDYLATDALARQPGGTCEFKRK